MYLNNNLGNIIVSNDPKFQNAIKPMSTKLGKKRKPVSDLQLSFELFRKKLIDSEMKSKTNGEFEDTKNMGSSSVTNEKLLSEGSIKQVSNDVKLIWLQSALNFIKNDHQTTLKFPTISIEESDFIEAILNQDCEPNVDGRFSPVYLSIKEALTIYKTKYIFALNTVFKNETTIKLELEKIQKNNKLKFVKIKPNKNEAKVNARKIKKQTKVLNDKMGIMKNIPMDYIIDCFKQILDFLDDDLRFTLTFDKLTKHEYDFMMNLKQIVKSKDILQSELPHELNLLLDCISTHTDYSFNFIPNRVKYEEKYVIIMKVPKGGVKGNFEATEETSNISQPSYNYSKPKDFNMPATEPNNNKILYRKIDNSTKKINECATNLVQNCPEEKQHAKEFNNKLFKSNNPYQRETKSSLEEMKECHSNSWDNVNISHWRQTAADSLSNYSEKKVTNQPKSIKFERGGSVDVLNEEQCKNIKKQDNVRGRSWSRDRDVNKMKSKMYEALSVPITSAKAVRMMHLMGWKGGALGSRGEGITEPIMPALGIQYGAGLGHGSNNFKINVNQKKEPQPGPLKQPDETLSKEKSLKKSKKATKTDNIIVEGEETRLKILSKILEFIKSCETKMVVCFNEILREEDTRFVICSIDRFNRRKYVRNLKSTRGPEDLREVQEVMLAKPHMNLSAKISEDKKEVVLTKTFKGENNNNIDIDFAIDSDDSIRVNVSVFRYIKSMKPKETYGVFTKPSYQLLGFKLSILEEILKFLDKKQSTLMLYIDIYLYDKHKHFIENFINVINMGKKPRYPTEAEELLVDKICNKIGDFCFILDYFGPLKIIKIQKRNRNTQTSEASESCVSKDNKIENEIKQTEVKDLTEQNNTNLTQINSLEFNIEKTVEKITTNIMNNLTQMYAKSINIVSEDKSQDNTHILKETVTPNNSPKTNADEAIKGYNTNIITIDLTEEEEQVNETEDKPIQNITITDIKPTQPTENLENITENERKYNKLQSKEEQEIENLENNLEKEIHPKDKEDEKEIDYQRIEDKDADVDSEDILKIISDLEKSIKIEEKSLEELNHKRNRSDSNDSQLQDTKKIKRHSIKCYKQIQITPNNSIETMNVNLAGIVQSLISNAIDDTDCLPLLQCSGIVDNKLIYICYDENTYIWLKKVLKDQFEVIDTDVNFEGRRKLKINLKTYIYDDTTKILNRIKLYNSYLDVVNWKIHKTSVSVDSTFLLVEVDEEDYNFISRSDFSLFAGIDKAMFSVSWD